jgi:hypothetical protein
MGLVFVAAPGCGKKGPPLAPIVHVPNVVEEIAARRFGNDVYITLTIPAENVDTTKPADVARIEVFGYTGRAAPSRARFPEVGLVVSSFPVAPPPEPPAPDETTAGPPPPPSSDPTQGAVVTVRNALTSADLIQGKTVVERTRPTPGAVAPAASTTGPLHRYYMAFGFSRRGRPGPPGVIAELPLDPLPDPAPSVTATYDETHVSLQWERSGGILGFLMERMLPPEPPPVENEEADVPAEMSADGVLGDNVYRALSADPLAPPPPDGAAADATWNAAPPKPLNPSPLQILRFTDTIEFERERCYTVRTVRGTGPSAVEGAESPAFCFTPIDTFPPAPPQQLAAIASAGAINLIWSPSTEPDLGGYVVLRSEAPSDTLQPLTRAPITDARYRDTEVKSGVRYVYAVIAVDNRLPLPNVSSESERVEETVR